MQAKAVFIRQGRTLTAVDDEGEKIIDHIKPGEKVLVHVHRARYPEHHRLAFAVFNKLADAKGLPVDTIVLYLKWETGHVNLVRLPNGKVVAEAKSINFESMGQTEFQAWWNQALQVVKEKLLPKISAKAFNEIRDIIVGAKREQTHGRKTAAGT
jgi:hypothetical protein